MQFYRMVKACSSSFFAVAAASLLLLASAEAQAYCKFFTGFADNKDGTVTDTRTGLIWKRCAEGYEFTNGVCTGDHRMQVNRANAKLIAEQSRFLDKNDWRLPTKAEFLSVMGSFDECKNNGPDEYAASKAIAHSIYGEFWTADSSQHPNFGNANMSGCWGRCDEYVVRLVRDGRVSGGEPSPEFVNELAKKEHAESRQRAADEALQRKEAQDRERKLAAFRKSIQEGDDTSSGVVIQVKGSLIKIQTNDSQCSQRDYNGNCTNYINTPAEKWFKRNEVYPK